MLFFLGGGDIVTYNLPCGALLRTYKVDNQQLLRLIH